MNRENKAQNKQKKEKKMETKYKNIDPHFIIAIINFSRLASGRLNLFIDDSFPGKARDFE